MYVLFSRGSVYALSVFKYFLRNTKWSADFNLYVYFSIFQKFELNGGADRCEVYICKEYIELYRAEYFYLNFIYTM